MTDTFFILSKMAELLVRAETILLLAIGLGLAGLRSWPNRRAKFLLGCGFFGFVLIGLVPVGDFLLAPLEKRYPANPHLDDVRAIIILGGAADPERSAYWRQPVLKRGAGRYDAAIALARRFPKAKVLFTGGSSRLIGTRISEAIVAREILTDAGIAPERLRFEGASRTTAENAKFLHKLVGTQDAGQWVLVTSAFHMPRAMGSFCASGWHRLVAWPTDFRSGRLRDGIGWNLPRNLSHLDTAVNEWIGLAGYYLGGRTNSLLPTGC
jgi:uncharacterized SAM-binding protein YcdF (DUF218 family)